MTRLAIAAMFVALLLAAGLVQGEPADAPAVEPRSSTTAEGQTFREMAFTDPDGHLVVLYPLD